MKAQCVCFRTDGPVADADLAELLGPVGTAETGRTLRGAFVYHDSFDWRLAGRGLALRERDREAIELADARSGRIAATAPGRVTTGFAADLPPGRLRRTVAPVIEMRRLLERLQVRLHATATALRDREGKTVLRLRRERWECRAAGGRGPAHRLWRIVLDPVRGYSGALQRAAAALEQRFGPGVPPGDTLCDALTAVGAPPEPGAGKLRPGLTGAMTAGEASRTIHLALLDAMARNEAGAAADIDSEFLHDFRVALRRGRSALALVDKGVLAPETVAEAKAAFRWIARQTNLKRDLDVCLLDIPDFEAVLPAEYRACLRPFRDHLLLQSRRESRRIARLLRGQRYRRMRDTWRDRLGAAAVAGPLAGVPVRDLAARRIRKAHRRLLREGGSIDADSPPEALHALRITAKRLRYLLEFFGELYPPRDIARLVTPLKRLQDVLGRFQDSVVQSERIVAFAREMAAAGEVPVETHMAMGMVADSILARGAAARRDFHDSFRRFARPGLRAIFAALFGNGGRRERAQ